MSVKPAYPGAYVEEIPSGVRTIVGAGTSTTVFAGWAARGPIDRAQRVLGFGDFARHCGGLDRRSLLGYAVRHFFDNGGLEAHIVRLTAANAAPASLALDGKLRVTANSPGKWGNEYAVETGARADDPARFRFALWHQPSGGQATVVERFDDLSLPAGGASRADGVINANSEFVKIAFIGNPVAPPADTPANAPRPLAGGLDGDVLAPNTGAFERLIPQGGAGGIFGLLDRLDTFNLLAVPGETTPAVVATLQAYCRKRRAFCILDAAQKATFADMRSGPDGGIRGPDAMNSALYFPWVNAADPLEQGRVRSFPPSGFIAGIYARTDAKRGVWKAPAGTEADLRGATDAAVALDDQESGELNSLAINCIRRSPSGIAVRGSRTLRGADASDSEWKYVSVRRLALFIESSVSCGTRWAVFEPNGEPLWKLVRWNVGIFMDGLFRQGAFQGSAAKDAWFVKCDSETTTQDEIENGVVNIAVGFAPLKPAEFVIIKIRQSSG